MTQMKAVRVKRFGGPEAIALEQIPRPEPRPGEVLVRVIATSINPVDWKLREGMMTRDIPLPFTPGGDFSGIVEAVGDGVTDFAEGREVFGCAPNSVGADAEYLVAPAAVIAPKPKSLDHTEAASVPLAGMTAWQALFEHGRLVKRQSVLILGGSGGVGGFAIQFAKAAGAAVYATASTPNVAPTRALGADEVIDYKTRRVEEIVRDVDLCLDLVGGDFAQKALACVKSGGLMVSTVQPPDVSMFSDKGIRGKMMVMRPNAEHLREIAKLIDTGRVKVRVSKVMPLDRAAEAEELNRRGEADGKIVLQVV
jgi:NADPH:quinone reductase-like Zn-dependent oxidoreductase